MRVEVVSGNESLATVSSSQWNTLSTDSFYTTFEWTKFTSAAHGDATMVAIAHDGGEVVGILPIRQSAAASESLNYRFDDLLQLPGSVQPWIAGAYRGYDNGILTYSDRGERYTAEVLRSLVAAARTFLTDGHGHGECRPLVMPFLTAANARTLIEATGNISVPLLHSVDAELILPDVDSWSAYLSKVDRSLRYRVRREIRDFTNAGLTMSTANLADVVPDLAPLVSDLQRKHGFPESVADVAASLERQASCMGHAAIVFLARDERETPMAGALYYAHRDTLYGRMAGISLKDQGKAYFPTYIHKAVEYAIQHGFKRICFGRRSLTAKCRRGARARSQWLVTFDAEWLRADSREVNTRQLTHLAEGNEQGSLPTAVDQPWFSETTARGATNA